DVLGGRGRMHAGPGRPVVPGGEDDGHLLVPGRAGDGVAHELVVELRVRVVARPGDRAPGVGRDARARVVGARQADVRRLVAHARAAVGEHLRVAELHPGRDAQAVLVALRVLEGRAGG